MTYIERRNKLIPLAAAHANKVAGIRFSETRFKNPHEWANTWNREFLGKMDSLAKQKGLIP